jgi:hypothetical protein
MRRVAVTAVAFLVPILATGCGATRTVVRTVTVSQGLGSPPSAPRSLPFYGRVASITRRGDHYELRFDPAWFLSGVTANVAAAEDQGMRCRAEACPPVPNDHHVLDEGHRRLTFLLPRGVRGTVLVQHGSAGGPFPATSITAGQLARLVHGASAVKLFEPLSSGMWLLVRNDTVLVFAQQYVP